jgi:hypothetical protein
MSLTSRDRAIIHAVYEHRFLRRDQIARLFFRAGPGARSEVLLSSCNTRLQKLYQHGYLTRTMPPAFEGSNQAVYALDRRGVAVVAADRGVDVARIRWSPKMRSSELYFQEHTLEINEVWLAFELVAREDPNIRISDWAMDGPTLWDSVPDASARRGRLPVRPDAYLGLSFGEKSTWFFLEVDRGTMTNRRFAEKVRAYRSYWRDGAFTERYGRKSFRVLTVAPSARRRDNLRRTAGAAGAQGMFLFATLPDARTDVLGSIWYPAHRDQPTPLTP